MENDLLEKVSEGTVYTSKTIVVSSFFGGILASSYMLYHNFKIFGEHKKASLTILLSICLIVAVIATAFSPALSKIPGFLFSIFITVLTSFITNKFQLRLISNHIATQGKIFETGKAVAVCIIGILAYLALALGAFYLQDSMVGNL